MAMTKAEADLRLALFNTLLTCPHRHLATVRPVHDGLAAQDPLFYVRLAAWYSDHGDVRDHKEMFVVTLCLSAFPGHREVGLALLRQLPPYQVLRVVDFISGRKETVKVRVEAPQDPAGVTEAATKSIRKARRKAGTDAAFPQVVTMTADTGLFRNVPRSLRTEVTRYLREREADPAWFDASALVARKAMKRLYALLHVKPGPRAQAALFDDAPPADSKLAGLKRLANARTADEQAALIGELDLPFRVAVGAVRAVTPAVLEALVGRMSPQEVINNLEAVRRRGGFDSPEVKALVERKLEEAKTAGRVSAFKAGAAKAAAAGLSEAVRGKLDAVVDAQVKARGRIARPTALLIDKSGSMEAAIELGKRIGAMLAAVCDRELYVYAFDTIAYPVTPAGPDLAAWDTALRGITAGGSTSVGAAVEVMRKKRQYVEQFVVVTDEGENAAPNFVPTLKKYREEVSPDPTVCFVKTPGATHQLESECQAAGLAADAYPFAGDYYALPNLVPLLARPSKLELLQEILEYPLPTRKPA
jgi:hypothetical protein